MDLTHFEAARELRASQKLTSFSFDVFDTILLRRCSTSEGVFERTFELSGLPASDRPMRRAFIENRNSAEARAREAKSLRSAITEVTIDEIWRCFPVRLFGLEADAARKLAEWEFAAELDLCFADKEPLQLLADLRSQGVQAGLISDTYWSGEQLTRLLLSCARAAQWDFLYASSDHGVSKSNGLFDLVLKRQGLTSQQHAHIGDNLHADCTVPRKIGVHCIHYPQAGEEIALMFRQEDAVQTQICSDSDVSLLLDGGARTHRRLLAIGNMHETPAFRFGTDVLGPIMHAFDQFVARRTADITAEHPRCAVAFLSRDGFLPFKIATERGGAGAYVELSRRIALLSVADTVKPITDVLNGSEWVDYPSMRAFFGIDLPKVKLFFSRGEAVVSGPAFAKALPKLIDSAQIKAMSAQIRRRIIKHFQASIAGFDTCTDLVLVDIGYFGTVQAALTHAFAMEGRKIRLHGLYLLSADQALGKIASPDTAEGLISALVVSTSVQRALLRNIALLEQFCCAPNGSALAYRGDGEILRAPDLRSPEQLASTAQLQAGCQSFCRRVADEDGSRMSKPSVPAKGAAERAATVLARLLLTPNLAERTLFRGFMHDTNLGSDNMTLLGVSTLVARAESEDLPSLFSRKSEPMWPALGWSDLSPLHPFLYLLHSANRLPSDFAGDQRFGTIQVGVLNSRGDVMIDAEVHKTHAGDLRLRVPLVRTDEASTVVIPAQDLPRRLFVRALALKGGATAHEALFGAKLDVLPTTTVQAVGFEAAAEGYLRNDGQGVMVIPIPVMSDSVGMLVLTLGVIQTFETALSAAVGETPLEVAERAAPISPP